LKYLLHFLLPPAVFADFDWSVRDAKRANAASVFSVFPWRRLMARPRHAFPVLACHENNKKRRKMLKETKREIRETCRRFCCIASRPAVVLQLSWHQKMIRDGAQAAAERVTLPLLSARVSAISMESLKDWNRNDALRLHPSTGSAMRVLHANDAGTHTRKFLRALKLHWKWPAC
jgi:hypothetical protein